MEFYKYEGAGNDFILIDDRSEVFPDGNVDLIAKMCDRHFGIGADGLMLLRNKDGYDFEMVYFNSDGRPSSMCGNGGRCITQFASDLGVIQGETHFLAVDGPHHAKLLSMSGVSLQMGDVHIIESLDQQAVFLNTGSPHYVAPTSGVSAMDIVDFGRSIRYSDRFRQEGVNVNAVEWLDGRLYIRTYERGVENETLACGTGVTAAAIAAHHWGWTDSPVNVKAEGGDLEVSFEEVNGNYRNVWKSGPATFVFKGNYEL